jgi:phosphotransferase system HPr (HPr) family protein
VRQITLRLTNKVGLHARPAALFVQAAAKFHSEITVRNVTRNTDPVNAKAILAVLTMGAEYGHDIQVAASGADEVEGLDALSTLITSRFGEE